MPIVDPKMQIAFKGKLPKSDPNRNVPDISVGRSPWRIRPNEGRNRGKHQHNTTGSFDGEKPFTGARMPWIRLRTGDRRLVD
jgi:hypothetical protein